MSFKHNPCQHLCEDHAEGLDIGAGVDALGLYPQLWSDIRKGLAAAFGYAQKGLERQAFYQVEVGDFEQIRKHEHVFGLEISVPGLFVGVVEGGTQLVEDRRELLG